MRVKAVIAYDGSAFFGFQRQTSTPFTVTQALEDALKTLQIHTKIVGSGRTDRYVHATAQVIHFDLPDFWKDLPKLTQILNRRLTSIRIKQIRFADETFHARFSAKKRYYRYLFKTEQPSVFEEKYLSFYPSFDPIRLKEALRCFEGEHDFRYFHKTGSPVHTTVRTIFQSRYYRHGNIHVITFEADGFLRSQVRLMVEAAMQYAQRKIDLEALCSQLGCKKQYVSKPAPPEGLYLARIRY